MNKVIPYVIILILSAGLSFFLGALFLGSKISINTDGSKTEAVESSDIKSGEAPKAPAGKEPPVVKASADAADNEDTEISPERKKGSFLSFLFPSLDSEKGLQKKLSDKQIEISGIKTVLSASGTSYITNKLIDMMLFASAATAFNKIFLFTANHLILIVVIPIFIIISIILMILNKNKKITSKLIIKTVVYSLIIIFILPASFYISGFAEKLILNDYINSIVTAISEKGADLTSLTINYFAIFLFTNLIIPALIVIGVIGIVIYFKKRLLTG